MAKKDGALPYFLAALYGRHAAKRLATDLKISARTAKGYLIDGVPRARKAAVVAALDVQARRVALLCEMWRRWRDDQSGALDLGTVLRLLRQGWPRMVRAIA